MRFLRQKENYWERLREAGCWEAKQGTFSLLSARSLYNPCIIYINLHNWTWSSSVIANLPSPQPLSKKFSQPSRIIYTTLIFKSQEKLILMKKVLQICKFSDIQFPLCTTSIWPFLFPTSTFAILHLTQSHIALHRTPNERIQPGSQGKDIFGIIQIYLWN